jgi:hypothetical protein
LLSYRSGFVAAAAALLAAGCFTSPVNMSPTVRIDTHAPVMRDQNVTFTATTSDPNGGQPTLSWLRVDAPCSVDASTLTSPTEWPSGEWLPGDPPNSEMIPAAQTLAPFCLWAKARDGEGAATVDAIKVDPVDRPPNAALKLNMPADAASFPLNTMFVLSAEQTTDPDDPDLATLQFAWCLNSGPPSTDLPPCPGTAKTGPQPFIQGLTAKAPGLYVVEVQVTDPEGATSVMDKSLLVLPGEPPVAAIDITAPTGPGPFPLGAQVRLSAENSTGGDPTTLGYTWHLEPASGSGLTDHDLGNCPGDMSKEFRCFVPDVDGAYRVSLVVTNDNGMSPKVSVPFSVAADQPPCIDHTTPDIAAGATMMTMFMVDSVSDDRDASNLTFEWFVGDGMSFALQRTGASNFELVSSVPFAEVFVRVQISDRDTQRSATEFAACGNADTCSLPSLIHPDTCLQRVTWKVNVRNVQK